jgi:hypothetical protein
VTGDQGPQCLSLSTRHLSLTTCARRGSNPQPLAPEARGIPGNRPAVADLLPDFDAPSRFTAPRVRRHPFWAHLRLNPANATTKTKSMATEEWHTYRPRCQTVVLGRRDKANHLLHFIITFFTCGLWIIPWVFIAIGPEGKPFRCPRCGTAGINR